MIQNAKYFTYNNISLSSFENMRIANDSSDMYGVQIIGSRQIIEEKIPGRQAPYLYKVDDTPLTLSITVALEEAKPISELRSFFRWIYNNDTYKQLWFDTDPNKFYYALFIGEPVLTYIERSSASDISNNDRKLIGMITLTARTNAGTAFGAAIETTQSNPTSFSLVNNGDDSVFPSLVIQMADIAPPTGTSYVKLLVKNNTNNSSIEFVSAYRDEEITVDMSTRRISTDRTSHNIYESWTRGYLELESGANNIVVTTYNASSGALITGTNYVTSVKFTYQPIRYI